MKETDKFITRICCEPQIKNIDGCGATDLAQEITTMRVKEIDEGIIGQLREIMRIKGITELFAIDESKVMQLVKEHKALEIIKKKGLDSVEIACIANGHSWETYAEFQTMKAYYWCCEDKLDKELKTKEEYDLLKEAFE